MKVLCIKWKGKFFQEGSVYTLDEFDCVYNSEINYTSAEPWFMYVGKATNFIPATDLIIALN